MPHLALLIPKAVTDSDRLKEVSVIPQGGMTDYQFGEKNQKNLENSSLKGNLQTISLILCIDIFIFFSIAQLFANW